LLDLTPRQRTLALHILLELVIFINPGALRDNVSDDDLSDLRPQALGVDKDRQAFWYFEGMTLFREKPVGRKRQWSAVCHTAEEWKAVSEPLSSSGNEGKLRKHIQDVAEEVVAELEYRDREAQRRGIAKEPKTMLCADFTKGFV